LTAVENTHHALQRTYNEQSRRLADAHASIATLTSAAAAKKASTASEFSRLMEENRILEKRGDEARAQITERESELERLVSAQESKEKSWEERWKKEERLRREAEKRSEDLKIVVERLSMAQGIGSDISPAAALAADQKMNGKSYTQFYVDYTVQESKLRAAENEVDRLTSLLDEISADIAEKVGSTMLENTDSGDRNPYLTSKPQNTVRQSSERMLWQQKRQRRWPSETSTNWKSSRYAPAVTRAMPMCRLCRPLRTISLARYKDFFDTWQSSTTPPWPTRVSMPMRTQRRATSFRII
jgi:nucleoprotein TPR